MQPRARHTGRLPIAVPGPRVIAREVGGDVDVTPALRPGWWAEVAEEWVCSGGWWAQA